MRIGSTIILLDGYCYQSYEWNLMRPLGGLQHVIDSLEKYQCDEIAIIRPIRQIDTIESFTADINIVSNINCMTPLSFGGGLRSKQHIESLHDLPIERLIFSSAFINKDNETIEFARKLFGHQAIQCLLPFVIEQGTVRIYVSEQNKYVCINELDFDFISDYANEIILYDLKNEGLKDMFEEIIYECIPIPNDKIVISGGVGKKSLKIAKSKGIASTLIENRILHKEFSIKEYKHA